MGEYKRWVDIFCKVDFQDLIDAANKHLKVVRAGKPNICCWWAFVLRGKKPQIEAVERDWIGLGATIHNRKPRGAWDI